MLIGTDRELNEYIKGLNKDILITSFEVIETDFSMEISVSAINKLDEKEVKND